MIDFSTPSRTLFETFFPASLLPALDQPDCPPAIVADACRYGEEMLEALLPFIPAPVADLRLEQPHLERAAGRYTQGTLLQANVAGFAEVAANLAAQGRRGSEELSALANTLFATLSGEIHQRNGRVISFDGDALTALFDAPSAGLSHPLQACAAALAMQDQMRTFAPQSDLTQTLQLRIGMHTGQMFTTEVGDQEQMRLIVTGYTVHRVAVAHDAATPGDIVISDTTAEAIRPATFEPRTRGFFLLRSMPTPPQPPTLAARHWQPGPPSPETLQALLTRIAALRPYLPPGLPARFLQPGALNTSGEFRPVTVLAANIYGFSKLLEVLEPFAILDDDTTLVTEIVQTYYSQVQAVADRYGGNINTVNLATVGDKFSILFGAPTAHEDDPIRAVQVALDLPNALTEVNRTIKKIVREWAQRNPQQHALLRVANVAVRHRVGIVSGSVFAGVVGTPEHQKYTVMGQTVELADRLMLVAKDGEILLPPQTRNAVRQRVETQPLPPVTVPGNEQPMSLYRAMNLHATSSSATLPHSAPLIGREHELARLQQIAQQTLVPKATGQVVALIGNPGSGKSRLIAEVLHSIRMGMPDVEMLQDTCQSYEQTTPYAVVARLLRREFPPLTEGDEQAQMSAVQDYVQSMVPEWSRFTPLLGPLLNLPLAETELTQALTPEQRRDRLIDLLSGLYLALARRRPLVLVIDDLHWADASSQLLLQRLATSLQRVPLLLVLGYRPAPEIPEPWRSLAYTTVLPVGEFNAEDSQRLLTALLQGEPPPELQPLIERTQGTPFFLEETVRYLVNSGALKRTADGTWVCTNKLNLQAVPIQVEQLITARIDRLGEGPRALLQVAAVVGQRFVADLLSAVMPANLPLDQWLEELLNASLIQPEGEASSGYTFKHALTRDVVYSSVLFSRRREIHAEVAGAIEQIYAVDLDDQRAVLAQHHLLADQPAQAFPHFAVAAEQARARYANNEAVTLYRQAIAIGPWYTQTESNHNPHVYESAIALNDHLGDVLTLIGKYDDARMAYAQARTLLTQVPQAVPAQQAALERKLAATYEKQGQYADARLYLDQARTLLSDNDVLERAYLDADAGWLAFQQGQLDDAERLLQTALQAATEHEAPTLQAVVLRRLAGGHFRRGNLAAARETLEQSLALSRRLDDQMAVAAALMNLGVVAEHQPDLAAAEAYYQASKEIYTQHGDIVGQIMSTLNSATTMLVQGRLGDASEALANTYQLAQKIGATFYMGLSRINQGRVAFFANEPEQARRCLIEAEWLYRTTNSHPGDRADAADYLGRLALQLGRPAVAWQMARRAIRLAEQGSNPVAALHARQLMLVLHLERQEFDAANALLPELEADPVAADGYELAIMQQLVARYQQSQGNRAAAKKATHAAQHTFAQTGTPAVLQRFV